MMRKVLLLTSLISLAAGGMYLLLRHQSDNKPLFPPKPTQVQRMISLAPNLTEIVFALGQSAKLSGRTDYCLYPPEAQLIPSVGGVIDPDIERIISLQPDVILLLASNQPLYNLLRKHVDVYYKQINDKTIEQILQAITELGTFLSVPERGRQLADSIRQKLEQIRSQVEDSPNWLAPRVMVTTGYSQEGVEPCFVVGKGGFIHQLIELAGGDNIFADVEQEYLQVSLEEIIDRSPQIIIEATGGLQTVEEMQQRLEQAWSKFPIIPAVQRRQLHTLQQDFILIPGPRISLTAQEFHRVFADWQSGKH